MSLQQAEEQIQKKMAVLEKLIYRHEGILSKIGFSAASYLEAMKIAKPLTEAAAAEIDVKGWASKSTVYGKRGLFGNASKRGKGIIQYLAEKSWSVGMLMTLIKYERAEMASEARFMMAEFQNEKSAMQGGENVEKSATSKQDKKLLGKVEGLIKECEEIFKKEARRDKKIQKIVTHQLGSLAIVQKFSIKEVSYSKGLTRFIAAPFYYKGLAKLFTKEAKFFKHFIRNESYVSKMVMKDIKQIVKVITKNEAVEKKLKQDSSGFKEEGKKAKKELKIAKNIRTLMKTLVKMQKSVAKIDKVAAHHGEEVSGGVSLLSEGDKALLEEEKGLENEMNNIDHLFEYLQNMSGVTSKIMNNIIASELRLMPVLKWINNSFGTMRKLYKKNPGGYANFLQKVGEYASKGLLPIIEDMHKNREEMAKEVFGEKGVANNLEKEMEGLKNLEGGGLKKNFEKVEEGIKKMSKGVEDGKNEAEKETKKSVNDMKADIGYEKQLLKREKKVKGKGVIRKGNPGRMTEMNAKIGELQGKAKELKGKYDNFKKEFEPSAKKIDQAVKEIPTFDFLNGGFFHKSIVGEIGKEITSMTKGIEGEEKEEAAEIKALKEWTNMTSDFKLFVKFLEDLSKAFQDEVKVLENIEKFNYNLKELEEKFTADVKKSEKVATMFGEDVKQIGEHGKKYSELFGSEGSDVLSGIGSLASESTNIINTFKSSEAKLSNLVHGSLYTKDAYKDALKNLDEILKIAKDGINEAKKTEKEVGRGQVNLGGAGLATA